MQSGLATLYRVRQQALEGKNRELVRIRQLLTRIDDQVAQLQGYREDYRIHIAMRQGDSTYRVQDRQLFLARLEQSIEALAQNRIEHAALEDQAVQELRSAYERAEALRKTMDRLAGDQKLEKLRLEQSQCDEQGRIATNCRLRNGN